MAAPMRDTSAGNPPTTANFEYDDNEWDIGIGDLIIDLDADIEKTGVGEGMAAPKPGKMHSPVEHQATVDKGLKMKIKRTKPGTKHEIVKSGENGEKHPNSAKRGSSGHRRDKKHGDKPAQKDVNGVVRSVERVVFPVGPGPPVKEKRAGSGSEEAQASGQPAIKKLKTVTQGSVMQGQSVQGGGIGAMNAVQGSVTVSTGPPPVVQQGGHAQQTQVAGHVPQQQVGIHIQPQVTNQIQQQQGGLIVQPQQLGTHLQQQQPSQGHIQQQQVGLPVQQQQGGHVQQQGGHVQQQVGSLVQQQQQQGGHVPQQQVGLVVQQQQQAVGHSQVQQQQVGHTVQQQQPQQVCPLQQVVQQQQSQQQQQQAGSGSSSSSQPQGQLGPCTLQAQQSPLQQPPQSSPPPLHQHQSPEPKELVDVCVGTSIGTITEPDCLGPCEPGTSVTLEGIVWHETEGVLVVNVTWRGKTYVGTLLDCTRHDWAPPRFCDSPTSDIDTRTPKGRGKRGRNASNTSLSDLSNFTETRSSVHSKLRSNNSSGPKGRKGPGSASPTPFATPKTDITPGKRKTKLQEEETTKRKTAPTIPPQPASPVAPPVLLECPEPNCSKKYKHINGLKYHQSHAHGSPDDDEAKESGMSEEEVPSPAPEIKKDELVDIGVTIGEDSLQEAEEKTVLRFGSEETALQAIATVPTPALVVRSSTPPLPSPPAVEPQLLSIPSQSPSVVAKVAQFKVKPASALMPDEKKTPTNSPIISNPQNNRPQNNKKKNKKSPSDSPHPSPLEPPSLGIETSREDVQSPAYSDISDDAAPLLESEVEGKPKQTIGDKKESGQSPQLQHYGMYPYYGQPPYLVPSVPEKSKETPSEKTEGKPPDKDKKEGSGEYQQKLIQQHYYQYGYHVPGYPFNVDGYPVVIDEKKEDKTPVTTESKQIPSTTQLHIPNPNKTKSESTIMIKDKHQNENHQILKESIEMKTQMNPSFLYQRQQQASQEDMRRYYIYPDRKESSATKATPPPQKLLPSPSPKNKEKLEENKKERRGEEDKKQEGVKPTMETQGPPPPPTSQYAYIHPGYMQSPHYGLPFDPGHPMYRGMNPMLVSGYTNSAYLHPQLHAVPRYHAPEDLSRPQTGKALDLLQHHASQYYSHPTHKIHELQERAIKSPTPKTSTASSASPSASATPVVPVTSTTSVQVQGKPVSSDIKDTRSPPPQRHVHTHHHTHVGLGYPILAGQYPAPYGAAVLASEHAAGVTSVPYQAK